jgi:hypothetical protein
VRGEGVVEMTASLSPLASWAVFIGIAVISFIIARLASRW